MTIGMETYIVYNPLKKVIPTFNLSFYQKNVSILIPNYYYYFF